MTLTDQEAQQGCDVLAEVLEELAKKNLNPLRSA
jgi:hypothetical protein